LERQREEIYIHKKPQPKKIPNVKETTHLTGPFDIVERKKKSELK